MKEKRIYLYLALVNILYWGGFYIFMNSYSA